MIFPHLYELLPWGIVCNPKQLGLIGGLRPKGMYVRGNKGELPGHKGVMTSETWGWSHATSYRFSRVDPLISKTPSRHKPPLCAKGPLSPRPHPAGADRVADRAAPRVRRDSRDRP